MTLRLLSSIAYRNAGHSDHLRRHAAACDSFVYSIGPPAVSATCCLVCVLERRFWPYSKQLFAAVQRSCGASRVGYAAGQATLARDCLLGTRPRRGDTTRVQRPDEAREFSESSVAVTTSAGVERQLQVPGAEQSQRKRASSRERGLHAGPRSGQILKKGRLSQKLSHFQN